MVRADWQWITAWFGDDEFNRRLGSLDEEWLDHVLRRSGLGSDVVSSVLTWGQHPPVRRWVAFVDPDNRAAFAFFAAVGWHLDGLDDEMYRFSRDV